MDEYDLPHTNNYDYVINVYSNDKIPLIIQKVLIDNNLDAVKYEYLTEKIYNTVTNLRNGLNILDSRDITNLGARFMFYVDGKLKHGLLQLWRAKVFDYDEEKDEVLI